MGLGRARPKPLSTFGPPKISLVSFVLKKCIKHENPTHIGFEIIYICINKPSQVRFHRIGALSFVFHLFNEKRKYKGKPCFPNLKLYQISFIMLFGLAIASYVYIGPAPL